MNQNDWILSVVQSFYDKAKIDILIGYHFRIIQDFDTHIPRIAAFWDLQLLGKTQRTIDHPFDVMNLHQTLGIKRGEIGRWLVLFRKTLEENSALHPEMLELKNLWLERLTTFEGIFLRQLGL